jgi:hypothetical protein
MRTQLLLPFSKIGRLKKANSRTILELKLILDPKQKRAHNGS